MTTRTLKVSTAGEPTVKIKADYSNGAAQALMQYFDTPDVYHVRGSLWMEGWAEFSINGKLYLVTERH